MSFNRSSTRMSMTQHFARERRIKNMWFTTTVIVGTLLAAGGIGAMVSVYMGSHETKTCKVETTNFSTGPEGKGVFRVATDCGVMSVEDSLLFGKFNAADTYYSIKEGKTYRMELVGFRNGFASMYPNILSVQPVS